MEYITISRDSLSWKNILLLRRFEFSIYRPSFPDKNERESFGDIIPRIRHSDPNVHPYTYCVIAMEGGVIQGGLVADWYPGCNALEIIYIAVNPDSRGKRIGSNLLKEGLRLIRETVLKEEKGQIENAFLEVERPIRKAQGKEINPVSRVAFWEKLGARHIPIQYTQPPLSQGKAPATNLMLLTLPVEEGKACDRLDAGKLKLFLKEFYRWLDAPADSIYLTSMIQEINDISEGEEGKKTVNTTPLFHQEKASAETDGIVLTSHFAFNHKGMDVPEVCFNFNSFECDLMNYSHQIDRPFKTIFFGMYRNVTVTMPELYCYTSEGITNYRKSLNKTVKADISLSVTFPSTYKKAVAHMSITPAAGTSFNDLDIIKFIKPHGSHQENYMASSELIYTLEGSKETLTDTELLQKVIGGKNYLRIPEGVTQVDTLRLKITETDDVDCEKDSFDDFYSRFITDSKGKPEDKVKKSMTNKLLCGLILGIFDYKRMDVAEIIDTVRPIVVKRDSFMTLCRGHLIKFEEISEDEAEMLSKILISPYILIPSAMLALNGLVLKQSEDMVDKAFKSALNPFSTKSGRAETLLNNEYIENLFQYPSEQEIIQTGCRQRNMTKRDKNLIEKIGILKARDLSSSDIIIELVLAAIALFEAIGIINNIIKGKENFPLTGMLILGAILIFEIIRWTKARIS